MKTVFIIATACQPGQLTGLPTRGRAAGPAGGAGWRHGRATEGCHQPVPAAARGQPGRLVAVVRRGLCRGESPGRARAAVGRLLGLPLVPRDGARVVRGPGHRRAGQRQPGRDQGGPRGAAGRGRGLHDRDPGHDPPGWLADDRVHDRGPGAVLLRHLLPPCSVPAAGAGRGQSLAGGPGHRHQPGQKHRRGPGRAGRAAFRAAPGHRRQPRRHRGRAGAHLRPGRDQPGGGLRRGGGRVRRRAQVPAVDGARIPAPPLRTAGPGGPAVRRASVADGRRHGRRDGSRRHVRPARRGVRAVFGGPGLGGAALREDALRQRPARPGLRAPVAAHRVGAGRAGWPGRPAPG